MPFVPGNLKESYQVIVNVKVHEATPERAHSTRDGHETKLYFVTTSEKMLTHRELPDT